LETVSLPFQSDDPVGTELTELLTRTRGLVESQEVDVLHAHLISGMKIAAQVAQETTVPLILTVHGAFYPLKELRQATEVSDHVIAVSEPVAKWLLVTLGLPRERLTVVPNGIDVGLYCPGERNSFRRELGLSPEQKLVVSCSRVTWGKTRGITAAIEAISQLAPTHDLHLAVVCSGSDTPLVSAMAHLVNGRLNRRVVSLVDARPAPVDVYRAADVVLGTARVALEAMSCGRPVIAMGNAGYVGFLRADNIEKAWKVYFGDHDGFMPITSWRLRDDLEWVLRNTEMATAMAEECRRWVVENFNIERVAQATEDIYRSLQEA
jgi:glycosyltransferase involved in cell wall biosynthesis